MGRPATGESWGGLVAELSSGSGRWSLADWALPAAATHWSPKPTLTQRWQGRDSLHPFCKRRQRRQARETCARFARLEARCFLWWESAWLSSSTAGGEDSEAYECGSVGESPLPLPLPLVQSDILNLSIGNNRNREGGIVAAMAMAMALTLAFAGAGEERRKKT